MLLEVKDLNSYYGASHILQGVSLTVGPGEFVALLGRNGMGKSTSLKSIMGLVRPRSGSIMFQGHNVTGYAPYKVARSGIGYVPEERRVFPFLSVVDNLMLGAKAGRDKRSGYRWTVETIFEHFPRLKQRARSQGRFLSGGEQQMLTIGRSLMGNPELLLIDEPTEGLAPIVAKEVKKILQEINKRGVAILLVEHNYKVAISLATRAYLMGKGHVGFSGTVDELRNSPEARAKYLEV
jgi:branched-chain amino acid transport system ATP-binding protein